MHQPQYLPWIGYFDRMSRADLFVLADDLQYVKDYFQQRTKIRTRDGWMWLSVPVHHRLSEKQSINETRIDNEQGWRRRHWAALQHSYSRAPFFADYRERFQQLYEREWNGLGDLNVATIDLLAEALGIDTPRVRASELPGVGGSKTDYIVSICRAVGADVYLSGPTGKTYLMTERVADAGVDLVYQDFEHPIYRQVYGDTFEPRMSAADMLFCCGSGARELLGRHGEIPAPTVHRTCNAQEA